MNKQKRYFKGSKTLSLGNIVGYDQIKGQNVKKKKSCVNMKNLGCFCYFLQNHLFQLSYEFFFVSFCFWSILRIVT